MEINQYFGLSRGIQAVTLKIEKPEGYLCRRYELPEPATLREYKSAYDDLKARFRDGERSINGHISGGLLIMDEGIILQYMKRYAKLFTAQQLPDVYERTTTYFWEEPINERLDCLHRIEALKRLMA